MSYINEVLLQKVDAFPLLGLEHDICCLHTVIIINLSMLLLQHHPSRRNFRNLPCLQEKHAGWQQQHQCLANIGIHQKHFAAVAETPLQLAQEYSSKRDRYKLKECSHDLASRSTCSCYWNKLKASVVRGSSSTALVLHALGTTPGPKG